MTTFSFAGPLQRQGALLVLAINPGCCPIPIQREVTVRPDLTVTVVDAGDAPVVADLIATRRVVGPPPDQEVDRWTARTDATGRWRWDAITARETSMPLMMHGVRWYGWQVCAEAPGLGSAVAEDSASGPIHPNSRFKLRLEPAGAPCAARLAGSSGR